ncbi:MAG TPA: hypothetical protein DCM68_05765 [Verrucomicrobia bacterium]|nr:hypothetical protein [Verrucomicrobiota bacterium]
MKTKIITAIVAGLVLATGSAASAAEPEGWQFELTPYLWAAGLEGDATINGHEAEFEKEFSDLFDMLDIGGSLLGVAQYNRFLVWGQVDYFSLSTDKLDVEDQPPGHTLDSKLLLGEAAVGYQFDGFMEGMKIDVLIGARMTSMELDLELDDGETTSKDNDLADPIIVLRPSIPIFPSKIDGLWFNPTLAIGGGGDADLVYELFPQFQYQITDHMAARLGYRTVGYKFEEGDNELNINLAGLIVGVGLTF